MTEQSYIFCARSAPPSVLTMNWSGTSGPALGDSNEASDIPIDGYKASCCGAVSPHEPLGTLTHPR